MSHAGQLLINLNFPVSKTLSLISTFVTFGIISPPFSIWTESLILTSSLSISLELCRDALLTIDPPNSTGSNKATGVIAPVLPT